MAKAAPDAVLDKILTEICTGTILTVCAGQPTTYTEAITTFKLADIAMTPDTDFTKANGDTSGRKVTVAAKSSVPVDTTGTGTYIALTKSTGTLLYYVTTCTSQSLTAGNTVNFPAWDIEILAPT